MPKTYCGKEHINVPPLETRLEQVARWESVKQRMKAARPERRFCLLPVRCAPGEAIRAQLDAEALEQAGER